MTFSVLVLENDDTFRQIVCEHLKNAGYHAIESKVIDQARAFINWKENARPAIPLTAAVIDVRMGADDTDEFDWGGLAIARDIGRMRVPVIILSAYDKPEDIQRAYQIAPDIPPPYAFISKNSSSWRDTLLERLAEIPTTKKSIWKDWLEQLASLIPWIARLIRWVSSKE